jgi:hypothetical protein
MATTDIYTIQGSIEPVRPAIRFRGGDTNEGVQVDALIAAIVGANHSVGSITAWVMIPDHTPAEQLCIFGAGDADAVEYMFFCVTTARKLQFKIYDAAATQVDVSSDGVIPYNKWVHVALVQNGGTPEMYINGVKQSLTFATATQRGVWFKDTDGIDGAHIGAADSIAGGAALTLEFKGYISDFKMWSGTAATSALTAEQVKADMNGTAYTTTLLAHYNMDRNVINIINPGTYNGTKVATAVYVDGNELASKLTFNPSFTLVTADNPRVSISGNRGFAILTDAA